MGGAAGDLPVDVDLVFRKQPLVQRVLLCIAFAEFLPAMMYAPRWATTPTAIRVCWSASTAGLFTAFMLCHGELAGLRPRTSHLKLLPHRRGRRGRRRAAGGRCRPAVLDALYDLPIALALTGIVAIFVVHRARPPRDRAQLLTYPGANLLD